MEFLAGNRIRGLNSERTNMVSATFEDDFTTDKSWAESGTQFTIDTSTNHRIDFALQRSGTDNEVYKDLTTVSDTAWVLRMHLNFTGSTSADGYNKTTWFGLSSTSTAFTANQDAIGFIIEWGGSNVFNTTDTNGTSINTVANTNQFATAFSKTGEYWVEIIRLSSTSFTVELFSDAYTTSIEKETTITTSSTAGLQYVGIKMRNSSSKTEIQNGWLDDIEFYNGVTTKPIPLLVDGSIFYETDTNKSYVLYNGSWTEL